MLTRRGFLGTLLASVGALTIDPHSLLWRPAAPALALPEVVPGALLTLNQITMEMLRHIAGYQVGPPLVITPDEVRLDRHLAVAMDAPPTLTETGLDVRRYIRPAAHVLADALRHHRVTQCGRLPIDPSIFDATSRVTDPQSGLSVRGALAYNPTTRTRYLKFDMVVAS